MGLHPTAMDHKAASELCLRDSCHPCQKQICLQAAWTMELLFDIHTPWNTNAHGFLKADARIHPGVRVGRVQWGACHKTSGTVGLLAVPGASTGAGISHRSSSEQCKEFYLKMLRWGLSFGFQVLPGLAELFVVWPRSAGWGPGSSSCLFDLSVFHEVLKWMNQLMKRNCVRGSGTEMISWLLFSWEGHYISVGKPHGNPRVSGVGALGHLGRLQLKWRKSSKKSCPSTFQKGGYEAWRDEMSPPGKCVHQSQRKHRWYGKTFSHSCPKAVLASTLDALALHGARDLPSVYYPAQSGLELVT